ncbi:hypothetical protein [Microbacterium invictum]|uniref:Uncharacterized protein n=1 Tax=Microbacterium invictum TaxID=515415 RepID=A0AA40SRA5_9MICO|nr:MULTISPECIES: hypothetical protein [Microbacterium]MBB4140938.1 hypothetical protein [Microbacterium invictum]
MSDFEQNLLYGVTTLILAGTLVAFAVGFIRNRRHDDDDRDGS